MRWFVQFSLAFSSLLFRPQLTTFGSCLWMLQSSEYLFLLLLYLSPVLSAAVPSISRSFVESVRECTWTPCGIFVLRVSVFGYSSRPVLKASGILGERCDSAVSLCLFGSTLLGFVRCHAFTKRKLTTVECVPLGIELGVAFFDTSLGCLSPSAIMSRRRVPSRSSVRSNLSGSSAWASAWPLSRVSAKSLQSGVRGSLRWWIGVSMAVGAILLPVSLLFF